MCPVDGTQSCPSERVIRVITHLQLWGGSILTKFRRWGVWFVVAVFFFACWFLPVPAQLTRGFISGIFSDPSSAILAGVQVTTTNTATNISRDTITNDAGFYRFSA